MSTRNFLLDYDVARVMNAVAAGTTDQNSDAVDMLGYDEVTFVASFGALTPTQVTKIKAQQSDDNGVADDWTDLEGTLSAGMLDADGNKLLGLSIYRPHKRYVRLVIDRGTANAVVDGVHAIKHALRTPVAQGTTFAVAPKRFSFPAEGTA